MNERKQGPVIVVGGLNLDVCGLPEAALEIGDSNPGTLSIRAGGVGHNIARHLRGAGYEVELIAPRGGDAAAELLARACAEEGVGLTHAPRLAGASPAYLCIHDERGDLAVAINAMSLMEAFTPEALAPLLPVMASAPLLVMDANLPGATLDFLTGEVTAPILLDPVSCFKAERARAFIGRLAAVKPNRQEAAHLSGREDPAEAADWFLSQGVGRVIISLGEAGVYYADRRECGHLPAAPMRVTNTNGAGDCMTAGIAAGMLKGLSARDCARSGLDLATDYLRKQGGTLL